MLIGCLRGQGAEVVHVPTIQTVDPPDSAALDTALDQLRAYDWIAFTSASGVRFTMQRLSARGRDRSETLGRCQVAAIGAGTERELAMYEIVPALVPPEAVAESLRDALRRAGVGPGSRVLLPQPLETRDVIAVGLRDAGAIVDVIPAYQTVTNAEGGADIRRWLDGPGRKVTIVTSPSTVRGLLALLDGDVAALAQAPLVCIGPVTAAAVEALGLSPALVAAEHSNDGLIAALIDYVKGVPAA